MNKALTITEYLRTPVTARYDVVVAGGGTAGVVAAIAAARAGARTAVVESGSVLGGTLLGGGIIWMSFFNNYLAHNVERKQLVKGIADEMVERLKAGGNSPGHYEERINTGHESVGTHVDRESLIPFLLDLLKEEGVDVYLRTMAVGAVMDGDRITGVITESKSGRAILEAGAVVDATGDGDVAARAGAGWTDLRHRHPIGYIFGMGNVDLERTRDWAKEKGILQNLGIGVKDGVPDQIIRLTINLIEYDHPVVKSFMSEYGHWGPYIISCHKNEATYVNGMSTQKTYIETVGEQRFDSMDVESLSRAAVFLRRRTAEYAELLREYVPGFENAYVNWGANNLGVRSTRCVTCDYDITRDDVVESHIPADSIALFGSCDAFGFGATIKDGGWFGIPFRALLPKGVEGLLCVGRQITSDWVAHMSTRLVAAGMAQGEAAGTAAAMSVRRGVAPRALPVAELQEQLRENGAYLDTDAMAAFPH